MIDMTTSERLALITRLRNALHALLTGEKAQEVEFIAGNGTRRRVRYSEAKVSDLRAELTRQEAAYAQAMRQRPKRHAIVPGGQR